MSGLGIHTWRRARTKLLTVPACLCLVGKGGWDGESTLLFHLESFRQRVLPVKRERVNEIHLKPVWRFSFPAGRGVVPRTTAHTSPWLLTRPGQKSPPTAWDCCKSPRRWDSGPDPTPAGPSNPGGLCSGAPKEGLTLVILSNFLTQQGAGCQDQGSLMLRWAHRRFWNWKQTGPGRPKQEVTCQRL